MKRSLPFVLFLLGLSAGYASYKLFSAKSDFQRGRVSACSQILIALKDSFPVILECIPYKGDVAITSPTAPADFRMDLDGKKLE